MNNRTYGVIIMGFVPTLTDAEIDAIIEQVHAQMEKRIIEMAFFRTTKPEVMDAVIGAFGKGMPFGGGAE